MKYYPWSLSHVKCLQAHVVLKHELSLWHKWQYFHQMLLGSLRSELVTEDEMCMCSCVKHAGQHQ